MTFALKTWVSLIARFWSKSDWAPEKRSPKVRLLTTVLGLRLVGDVAERGVIVFAESVIDAHYEGVRIVWLGHAEVGRADLDGHTVDRRVL